MSDPTFPQPPADHSVKIPHLVFGLLFLGIAGIWALVVTDVINTDSLAILAPAVLIVAGVVGLAVSLASGRNRRNKHPEQGYDDHQFLDNQDHDNQFLDDQDHDPVAAEPDDHTQEIR